MNAQNLILNHGDHVYLEGWTGIYDDTTATVGNERGPRNSDPIAFIRN